MSSHETILIEKHGRCGLVRFNRPKVFNALNVLALGELMDALEQPLTAGMESEKRAFHRLFATRDQKEGMRA